LHHVAKRKVNEKKEIDKLKTIARRLEDKHRKLLTEEKGNKKNDINFEAEVEKIIKQAQEKARQIEDDARAEMQKFIEAEQKDVQSKMVDLVMGVTKKVLTRGLTYSDHKGLIEEALSEMEGENAK
jgi:exonuclease VII large subunit